MRISGISIIARTVGLLAAYTQPSLASTLLGIPTLEFDAAETSSFSTTGVSSLVVDSQYATAVDTEGETLIPPTLSDFAKTFSADLAGVGLNTSVSTASSAANNSIFLTIDPDRTLFLDAAGKFTSEGYVLSVTASGITIKGASPLGVWWGTRTVLQQAVLKGSIPLGTSTDAPGWGTRGIMLDMGRHYYPPSFLKEMCAYLSFYKQNTFHMHLSDNLYNNVDIYTRERSLELYAAFRLNSPDPAVAGLVKPYRENETYTQDVFEEVQQTCAQRGVTVIPEIEAPGHALVITQWKPELGLDDLSLLNITQPETIPTMETIWSTFLPWFHSKTVHIGADEYSSSLADDYNLFVNTLSDYMSTTANKSIRIWGTNEPGTNSVVSTNITIQHWEYFEDNPYTLIKDGYTVLNSDDSFYIVNKYSASYPQTLNLTRIFSGNPAGGAWAPYVFDTTNSSDNPQRSEPKLAGHIAALWNDYGANASTVLEAYYAFRDGLPALADKQWGGNLTSDQYSTIFDTLHASIPGQNLDRAIPSKGDLILQYNFTDGNAADTSGNGYAGECTGSCIFDPQGFVWLNSGGVLTTPLTSKGRNYTLSFNIFPNETAAVGSTLLAGPDSTLLLGNGTNENVMLVSGGNPYALNYSLPRMTWSAVSLIGRGGQTFLSVDGGTEMEFLAMLGINGAAFVWEEIAIEAPLAEVGGGGFVGAFDTITLRGSA